LFAITIHRTPFDVSAYRTPVVNLVDMARDLMLQWLSKDQHQSAGVMIIGKVRSQLEEGGRMRVALQIVFALIASIVLAPIAVSEEAFPVRPIRLIVPYPAGGATDVVARIVAEKMSEKLGQQIFIDNRPGAGTMLGAAAVARSSADGYTMLAGDTATYALNPTLYGKQLTYDPIKDFAPVCRLSRIPLLHVVNSRTLPVGSLHELVAAAQKQPGKIDFGAPGPGSPIHLAMEMFRQRAGIDLHAVPYKGGADALNDVVSGRVALLFIDAATGLSYVKSDTLRALGVGADKRLSAAPDLPTVAEQGFPGFEAWAWNGFAVPTGTPRAIVDKLNAACQAALGDAAVERRFAEINVEPAPTSADGFGAYIKSEAAKWNSVITEAGISIN
jgi:tripartite-type tricarboxylate transporter receptor subunit TctC